MADEQKNRKRRPKPVPYAMLAPGFEGIYTGKKSRVGSEQTEVITTVMSDDAGNEIRQWPVVSWTWPGEEGDWDEEIRALHTMQTSLGPLDEATRRIRAHIGSLVPCDSGFPVTVDELLQAIGSGRLDEPSFHNGCWCPGMWWPRKTSQPGQPECLETIRSVLRQYLAGDDAGTLRREFPHGGPFVDRVYKWLGPVERLQEYQWLMIERILLTIGAFIENSYLEPLFSDASVMQKQEQMMDDLFGEEGRGARLDREIAANADLPKIIPRWKPEYRETLDGIESPEKQALYEICCAIASGVHTLSDCHHNTFRYIEGWIHGAGTGQLRIATRKSGTENERLGRLLFGYVLALDKWLMHIPMPFLLLDLGHVDLGFDPRNEILRVYAYFGEDRSPVKVWLAGWLWYTLMHSPIGGNPGGLVRHRELLDQAGEAGLSVRDWMDGEKDK